MNIFRFFLGGRRWALYMPYLVAYVLADTRAADFSYWWIARVGTALGIPFWLAYWLSDAFKSVEVRPFNTW